MIGRVRESRNPKKVIRVSLRESYGEIRRVPVNLLQTKAGFEDFVLAFLLGVDVVGGFIGIGQGFVMIDLIAEVTFRVGKIIPIPCLAAVQLAALGYGGILVFVDVVGVLAALGGKAAVLAGAFQPLV